MQDGFTYAYTPHVMEDWVTDVPNGIDKRSVPLKFNFLVAMEGSLGIGADLNRWTSQQLDTAKQMIAYDKTIRDTVQNGSLYRLDSMRNGGNFAATEYVAKKGSQVVLFAFLHSQKFGNVLPPLRLRGLDGHSIYKVYRIDNKLAERSETLSGDYLMHRGISLRLTGDYDSTSLRFDKVPTAR